MTGLLKPSQLEAFRAEFAKGFTTEATFRRPTYGSDELGDDAAPTYTTIGTEMGWLSSAPTAEPSLDTGRLVTSNTYRFECAPDADIRPRDRLDIGDNTYVVTDTTADESLPICLSCSLRLVE